MHPDLHTDLYDLDSVEKNLRHSAKGSLDAYDVTFSLTSEGWTPRNEALLEAVLKQARTTRDPWLIACDANMCP